MGVVVVTGRAGAGKSALLKKYVTYDFQREVSLAVHLRQQSATRVAGLICANLGILMEPSVDPNIQELLLDSLDNKHAYGRVLVFDSLDEAGNAAPEIANLLWRLGKVARVVVAVRSGNPGLIRILRPDTVIDLDSPEFFSENDLRDFVIEVISQGPVPSPPQSELLNVVANCCRAAGSNFLVAGLLALSWDEVDLDTPRQEFTRSVEHAMEKFVGRLGEDMAWEMLLPLAVARDPGWPESMWQRGVQALSRSRVSNKRLRRFRRGAAEYILEATNYAGESHLRLFHDALAATVRSHAQGQRSRATALDRGLHESVTSVLCEQAEESGWASAHSYSRMNLAAHAAIAGLLADTLVSFPLLCVHNPQRLHAVLNEHRSVALAPFGETHSFALSQLGEGVGRNAWVISLAARLLGHDQVASTVRRYFPDTASSIARVIPTVASGGTTGHSDWATAVAYRRIAGRDVVFSGGADRQILSWIIGENPSQVGGPGSIGGTVRTMAVTSFADSHYLVSGGDDCVVRIWPVGEPDSSVRVLTGHTDWVRSVTSIETEDDHIVVSGSDDGTVRLWAIDGELVDILRVQRGWVTGLAAAHETQQWFFASTHQDGSVLIWTRGDGWTHRVAPVRHRGVARCCAVWQAGADIYIASAGDDGYVRIWDLTTNVVVTLPYRYEHSIRSLRAYVKADGSILLLTGGVDQLLTVHHLVDGELASSRSMSGHSDWIRDIAVFADGQRVATASDDGAVIVWDIKESVIKAALHPAAAWTRCLADLGGGSVLAGATDGLIRMWQQDGQAREVARHKGWVRCLQLTQRRGATQLYSASDDGTVIAWQPGELGWRQTGETDIGVPVRSLCVIEGDEEPIVVLGADDGALRVCTGGLRHGVTKTISAHNDRIRSVCFFEDTEGRWLATGGDDKELFIWNLADLSAGPAYRWLGHTSSLRKILVRSSTDGDSKIYTTSDDGTLRSWDRARGPLDSVNAHKSSGLDLCFSSASGEDVILLASADETMSVWSLMLERRFDVPLLAPVFSMCNTTDGIAVASQRGLTVLDMEKVHSIVAG
ncbi:MAG: hypothetical protein ACRCYU_06055 [Nocardioides sp.]